MNRRWEPWLLVGPGLALYAVFGFLPILWAGVGSVYETGFYGRGWLGFQAFVDVFSNARFWTSLWVTVKFTAVLLPIGMFLTVAISVILSWAGSKLQSLARLAFFVPTVTSAMMISLAWRWIVLPGGPLSRLIGGDILWIASNPYAFWTICVMVVSISIGGSLLYMMAAFLSVDQEIYEAARLDGCNRIQEAWYVTVPAVMPVIVFLGVGRLSGLLQICQFPYSMTGGGPNYSTTTIMLLIYQEGIGAGRLPQASVMSLFLMVMVVGLVLLYRLISKRKILL